MDRNLYLDNLKAILIYLVVLGHFAHLNREIQIFGVINNIIYSFHMPLFIFVSGYLSKKIVRQRKEEITQILYAYLVFAILYLIFKILTSLGWSSYYIFNTIDQNWYLLGIFFWRLFLPYFQFFQKIVSIIAAVIIALSVGFYRDFDSFLALYRVTYFMPFFLLGYYCNDINLLVNKYVRFRYLFCIVLFMSFIIIFSLTLLGRDFNFAIGYAYTPAKGYYSLSSQEIFLRFVLRTIGFISTIIISFCFLFVIPAARTSFTHYGKSTLNVYLLHMFIVWPIVWLFKELNPSVLVMLFTSIIMSTIITIFLSTEFVNKVMAPLTNYYKMISTLKLNKYKKII
jgi:fucose 4-O-acetylase-like acetyltransferase